MAKRLDAAGEEVGLLALVDPRVGRPEGADPTSAGSSVSAAGRSCWATTAGGSRSGQAEGGLGAAARELRARFTSLDRRAPAERKFEQRIRAIRRTLVPSTIPRRVNVYVSLDWPLREWFWSRSSRASWSWRRSRAAHGGPARARGRRAGGAPRPSPARSAGVDDMTRSRSEPKRCTCGRSTSRARREPAPTPLCGGSSAPLPRGRPGRASASFAGPAGSRRSPSLGRGSGSTSRTRLAGSRRAGRRPRGGNRRREARFRAGLGGDRRPTVFSPREASILRPLLEPARRAPSSRAGRGRRRAPRRRARA